MTLSDYPEILSTKQAAEIIGIGKNGIKPLKDQGYLLEAILPGRKRPVITKTAVIKCLELINRKSMEMSI